MHLPAHFPSEPALLWGYFHQFTQLPRPSRHEDKVREFILGRARALGLRTHTDAVGNVIVYVPASPGKESAAPVIIQNHMDMVTDATPERKINFLTDPILTKRDGNWIKAEGTTLGADNGIGCAAALALMEATDVAHPPLELLFTIDEETGLKGAWGVDPTYLTGKRMLNLDTEEWGSFYIGCAGGIDYELTGDFAVTPPRWAAPQFFKLTVGGFLGGHSGVDIHEQRGNAIKCLVDVLGELKGHIQLHELRGGKAHNIIPRDAWALVSCDAAAVPRIHAALATVAQRWRSFLPKTDQAFRIDVSEAEPVDPGIDGTELVRVLAFLRAFPHGAHAYDLASQRELVALSNNLALCFFVRGKLYVLTSLRFFDRQECVGLEAQVQGLGELLGLTVTKHGEYPSWKPVRENKLLEQLGAVYERLHGKKAKVTAIHAGLECGILRDKIGPIDAVSFGPTIMGAHSPDERVDVTTVSEFWKLLTATLAEI